MNNSILSFEMQRIKLFEVENENILKNIQDIKNFNQKGTTAILGITLSLSILSFDFSNFFNFLNVVELLSVISLYDIDIPEDMKELLRGLRVQKSLPSSVKYFIKSKKNQNIKEKYVEYGYESASILENSGNTFIAFGTILILYVSQKLLLSNFYRKYPKLLLLKEYFQYNIFFKYWLQTSFDFLIISTYGLSCMNFKTQFSIFDFCICSIILVINN